MNPASPILRALADLYSESKAGRTGLGERDFLVDLRKLLAAARCEDGDDRELAMRQLREQNGKLLFLEGPRRDRDIIHQVRLPVANEAALFAFLNTPSPTERRGQLAAQFATALDAEVPERWREGWRNYFRNLQTAALQGGAMAPFSREDHQANAELLALLPKLLAWPELGGESLLRFASCVLTGNSKRLGELAPESAGQRRGKIGAVLEPITNGAIRRLEDLGILETPRFALLQGPLRLQLPSGSLDLGLLQGPFRLSETDIANAARVECLSPRCLTIENETTFHELAKLNSGELLLCTSYPGSATLALLQKLPATMEFWHFGDSDPEGFDILRDLRSRSGRPFQSLLMDYRPADSTPTLDAGDRRLIERLLELPIMNAEHLPLQQMLQAGSKGRFEQESLGRPKLRTWPFYLPPRFLDVSNE
jgi:hypothetical protein